MKVKISAGIIIKTARAHIPGQFIVNCAVKSISPTVNVFESVLLARFETNAYSFHEIKNAKIPADAIPDRDSGNSICQNAVSYTHLTLPTSVGV